MHDRTRRSGSGPSLVVLLALAWIIVVSAVGIGALMVAIDLTRAQLAAIYGAGGL